MPSANPSPRAAFEKLDPDLKETLHRSFADRLAGLPDAHHNLANGFWRGTAPATTWEALEGFTPMGMNLLVRLFDRIKAIDGTMTTWRGIKYLCNFWWGGSAGAKVVYHDPVTMRATLDGLITGARGRKVARDTYVGAMEHQLAPAKRLAAELLRDPSRAPSEPPDCDTWREVDRLGEEGVHFCVGRRDLERSTSLSPLDWAPRPLGSDDIHIDWMSPVKGIRPATLRCDYGVQVAWEHWVQATQGEGSPLFTFQAIDDTIDVASRAAQQAGEAAAGVEVELADFVQRWRAVEWDLAVEGKPGYEKSMPLYREFAKLVVKAQRRYVGIASEPALLRAISDSVRGLTPSPDRR